MKTNFEDVSQLLKVYGIQELTYWDGERHYEVAQIRNKWRFVDKVIYVAAKTAGSNDFSSTKEQN